MFPMKMEGISESGPKLVGLDEESEPEIKSKPCEFGLKGDSRNWANLPEVLLVKIYSYLKPSERLAPSLVCKHWEASIHAPSLWRDLEIIVGENDLKALAFADRYASSLKKIYLRFWETNIPRDVFGIPNIREFFEKLQGKTQLNEIKLQIYQHCPDDRAVVTPISEFLKGQNRLKILDLDQDFSDQFDSLQLLESAVSHSHTTIEILKMRRYAHAAINGENSSRFSNLIAKLNNLKVLVIDYDFMDADILQSLVQSHGSKLDLLEIHCDNSHLGNLSKCHWAFLRRAFRKSKVVLDISVKRPNYLSDLALMLPVTMPLTKICLMDYRHERVELAVEHFFRYLTYNFGNTLEECHFDFHYQVPNLESAIMTLLRKCQKIRSFSVRALLSVSFFEDVCKFYLNEPSSLQKLGISLLDDDKSDHFDQILKRYSTLLDQKGLSYNFPTDGTLPYFSEYKALAWNTFQ